MLEAAGYEWIILESVGAGQSDDEIAHLSDIYINLQMPASGDAIQAIKKGSCELADLIIIHKNDGVLQHDAERTKSYYKQAQSLQQAVKKQEIPDVLLVSSLEKTGFNDLWQSLLKKKEKQEDTGALTGKRAQQSQELFKEQLGYVFQTEFFRNQGFQGLLLKAQEALLSEETSPLLAARFVVKELLKQASKT